MGRKKANNSYWKKKQAEKKANAEKTIKRNFDRRGNKTNSNITVDKGSINIDQFTSSDPELIQVAITIFSSY